MLTQFIRSYGGAMQGMMGSYLEKNVQAFNEIQKNLQEQSKSMFGDNSKAQQDLWSQFMTFQGPAMQNVMNVYMEQSQKMFEQMRDQVGAQARTFGGFPFAGFPPGGDKSGHNT